MSALINIGTRAMFASYAALQTTGSNIANANTAGYSRQQVELEPIEGPNTGAGFFGRGVKVTTVSRATDAFLTRDAAQSRAGAAQDAARLEQLNRLEKVFPPGEQGVGFAAGELLNAFVDVANRPQDLSARQVVLARTQELATRFTSAAGQLDTIQAGVAEDVRNSVSAVNELAGKVAALNQQIGASRASGVTSNDLLDERDRLVSEISGYIQVTALPADDGTLGLFVGGGQRIVLGGQAVPLKAVPDEFDPSQVRLAVGEIGGDRVLTPDALAGGRLSGLLKFQSEDLGDARALLGQLASAIAGSLNRQQAFGLDLRQPAGTGTPLLSVGAPQVLAASGNSGPSPVTVGIVDTTQLQASDYTLRTDPAVAGHYLLTRLSDGLERSVAAGATVDGFQVNVGSPAPAASDRFLLRTVSGASAGMARVLDDPRGIAAASQVTATVGSGNKGTASVASVQAVSPTLDPAVRADITFTDNAGAFAYTLTGPAGVSTGTGTWTAGAPIALNGFELRLAGVPRSGDTLQVAPTTQAASNNGNALALLGLREQGIVGREALAGGGMTAGQSATDAYASAMADIGVRVQGAKSASDISTAVADNATQALSSRTGVNLDEEAARLIQYQQGYQAAAKVLQVAQSVFDSLLQATGR